MKKGFTLIELLVVVSIIGILLGLSVFGLQGARKSSRDATRKADLELIRSGLEIYKADCGIYPDDKQITPGGSLVGSGDTSSCSKDNIYITKIPLDPLSPTNEYKYVNTLTTTYALCAAMENPPSPEQDVTNCPDLCGEGINSTCNYVVTNP